MSADHKTIAANVPEDSEIAQQFEEFREQKSMNSQAEATRALLRAGLDQEFDDGSDDDDDRDGSDDRPRIPSQAATGNKLELQFPPLTYPLVYGVAFLVGSNGLQTSLESVLGATAGSFVFIFVGLLLVVWTGYATLREATSLFGSDKPEASRDVQPQKAD